MSNRAILADDGWNGSVPDWVTVLVTECDQSSQATVAKKLDVSSALVSQTIRNQYKGNMGNVETIVRETFMNAPVQCGALGGEIESATCLTWRRRAENLTSSSPMRVMMFHACRACPKFKPEAEE
ncbi:hypothetical protein [Pseudophaeobacter sp.]|uniref:hypothetical protein n=1 Tax=Pseudophaeobacter sp. TaxID=1971739 RepID=UPI002638843F|nr:hypothetical protein [Pseudophaeobacter sp.]